MSMSIASLEDLSKRLAALGRDHIVINEDGSIDKTTHWWFGRLVNRVLSKMFACEKKDNAAVCNKFVALIEATPKLAEFYADLGKQMLARRLSGDSPLSGRKAAKILTRILVLAKDDIHVTQTDPNTMLYREDLKFNIEKIIESFGKESIPYARALVRRLADTRGAFSKNEINDQLYLMMKHKRKELYSVAETVRVPVKAMRESLRSADSKTKLQKMQDTLISLHSSHLWQADVHPVTTWINNYTMKILELDMFAPRGELDLQPNLKEHRDVIQEMGDSYGEDAVEYAMEFMSLPLTTEEMLREEMRNTCERLQKDAAAIVNREIGVQGQGRGTTLANFIDQIKTERGRAPEPINRWMAHILETAAHERANRLLGRPNNEAQPADMQMLNLA